VGTMLAFREPVRVPCGHGLIVATEGRRGDRGLEVSVQVSNGKPCFNQRLFLMDIDAQGAFIRLCVARAHVGQGSVEDALPILAALSEEALRTCERGGHTAEPDDESDELHVEAWPDPPGAAAFHGLAGAIVGAIAPHTEADPAALLVTTLLMAGNMLGNRPHALAVGSRHGMNEFAIITGATSKGRKGSTLGHLQNLFARVDAVWHDTRIVGGLSSGEGVIAAVRDPSAEVDGAGQPLDAGVTDKRLMVIEEEFAAVLKVMTREGNKLSAIVRQAWDSGNLAVLTRHNPLYAHGAHISILGHITQSEALRYLAQTDAENGFANRFLWVCAKRSRLLPDGGGVPSVNQEVEWLHDVMRFGAAVDRPLTRDADAAVLWRSIYPQLSEGQPGLLGVVTGRAEAHVLRLSALYACLDLTHQVRVEHLEAALEVWRYCMESARWIFGEHPGANDTGRIVEGLRIAGADGLSRTGIRDLFGRNAAKLRIDAALKTLVATEVITRTEEARADGHGRGRTVYRLVAPHAGGADSES
jgi:hypothetical protein